jgi:branched-chain amino acid transport system substrate-binding protein
MPFMKPVGRRRALSTAIAAAVLPAMTARAQSPTLRIGVLNDMSGPYKDVTGPTSVACVQQALEDFGVGTKHMRVEVLSGDHQNKPDVGASVVRQWVDQGGVDCIIDVPNSAVALGVQQVIREKNKVYLNASLATNRLTGDLCSPNTLHWTGDTYMLANSTGGALVASGANKWFLLIADYALGHQLEKNMTELLAKAGGQLTGHAAYPPLTTTDFSSYMVQAQSSGANVLGLANAGVDTQNCIKQALEFGLGERMKIAALLMFINDIHALGLKAAQGLHLTETFYWDLNARTRAFTQRVLPKTPNNYPNMEHAGCYAAALHYLKAVAEMGVGQAKVDGLATVTRMKAMPFEDECFGSGSIRMDGQVLVTPYLFQVKAPSESTGPWDCYKLITSTPSDHAFQSLGDGHCPFVKA